MTRSQSNMLQAAGKGAAKTQVMNPDTQELEQVIERTRREFRFKYVGGGFFRDRTVPQGEKAEVRHGEEIVEEFCRELIRRLPK